MANTPDLADIDFHQEVIKQLIKSVDCTEHLKTSFQRFFGDITTNVKPKHLAYHLFLTATLYISKKITLDEEQMSGIYRIVEQLRQEWGEDDASSEHPNTPSCTSAPEDVVASTTRSVDGGDVGNACETLERIHIGRSTTPDSFVREAEKHTLGASNFYEDVKPKDATNLSSQYPYGFKLLSKQGWSNRSGLGPDGSGIQRPIDAHAMAHCFKDNGSPIGLGFASKSGSRTPTNGKSTKNPEKKIDEFASSWRLYAADPFTGDKSAKKVYGDNNAVDTVDTVRRSKSAHETTQSKGNIETTIHDQCVVQDIWKDTSKHLHDHHSRKSVSPHGSVTGSATVVSTHSAVFVPCTGVAEGW